MKQTEQIRRMLVARQQELEASLNRQSNNALDARDAEVQDETDRVITDENRTAALDLGTRDFQSLRDVQSALLRLDDGTYGRCVICGKEIEPARLAAIPETPYCLEHADTARPASSNESAPLAL